jgi:single-strand DNA-binding protein
MASLNRAILLGNLTRDPELKKSSGGTAICDLRLAANDRTKDAKSGEWRDSPNFFDVAVLGALAERCAQYLGKGRQVAIDGRLHWRSWESNGSKHEAVEVVADSVQFIGTSEGATASSASVSTSNQAAADLDDESPPGGWQR